MSLDDTFYILKNHKYKLVIDIIGNTEEESEVIIDNMRTTLDIEPTVLDTGEVVYYSLTLDELVSEIFCLGIAFSNIERDYDIICPFYYRVETV